MDVGSYGYIGDEIIRIDQINFTTNTITIGRGCLDSVPLPHLAGERLWFTEGFYAFDYTKWQTNSIVNSKMLPRTGSDLLDQNNAGVVVNTKTLLSRHYLPFPPGNVLFSNGGSYPDFLSQVGAVPATRMT